MRPSNVWRGCLFAYATGAGIGSLYVYALLLSEGAGSLIGLPILVILAGAVVALPFIGLAFGVHYTLAITKTRIAWWAAPLTLFALGYSVGISVFWNIGAFWIAIHCAWISAVLGLSFWYGAVGWQWSTAPSLAPEKPALQRPYGVR